ncbi:MAG: hypothetical protein JWQ40_469 [Segetibacter sp.]|jgi:hypothetical protein|nr:hypothetical protein [Segetibacter sp.]
MKKIITNFRLLILACFICLPTILMAQIGVGEPGDDVNDSNVPFDGGDAVLVAIGVGYGLYKAYEKRKENKKSVLQQA